MKHYKIVQSNQKGLKKLIVHIGNASSWLRRIIGHSKFLFVIVSLSLTLVISAFDSSKLLQVAKAENIATNNQAPVPISITPETPALGLPPNQPERGIIYDGLELAADSACAKLYRLKTARRSVEETKADSSIAEFCTHGPDSAPLGVDITQSIPPLDVTTAPHETSLQCDGDGVSGQRTEVIYVRASDRPDRYSTYLTSFQQWALGADGIYQNSAAETGGIRHVRLVHDANCNVIVRNVVLSSTGDDNFDNTINGLAAQGYNRTDRKYMLFVDANIYCGIGTILGDDQPGSANANNGGPSYGRTDAGCWGGEVAAHEHMHNLGGVQLSAPYTSGGYHCVDEYDLMCYSDEPNYPPMQYLCPNSTHDSLFDCNHNDYYSTNPPPNSYLATHWNTANSQFLVGSSVVPTNDPFNNPIVITNVPYNNTQNTAGATTAADDPVFPCISGQRYNTVWYRYTPSSSGTLSVNTFGSNYDTVLAVWRGSQGNLTNIGCNDDTGGGLQSEVVVSISGGTTYFIEIAGFSTTAYGSLTLSTGIDGDTIYVSSSSGGTAGGVSFADEDILTYNTGTGAWSMYFDGSDVSLGSTDIDAFELLSNGTILLSFDSSTFTVPGLGTIEDRDIFQFMPTSLGSNTSGSFAMYLDGSDIGLTTSDEDIDAIGVTPAGKLVISTYGSFSVTGASGADEDLLEFTSTSLGSTTSGTWAMYFDGSDVALTASSEDVWGSWIESGTGKIYLSTSGAFSVTGSSGDGADIFICTPGTLGNTTTCTFGPGLYWDGSANGYAGEVIDDFAIVP